MPVRLVIHLAASVVTLVVVAAFAPSADAEFCSRVMPAGPSATRGYTFEAEVVSVRHEGSNPPYTFVSLAISKVYANRDSRRLAQGRTIELYSNQCDGFHLVGLREGDKVLISTSISIDAASGPITSFTAVWRRNGGRLRLLVLRRGVEDHSVWPTSDRRIGWADTTREALALVAPGIAGVPDTSTGPIRQGPAAVGHAPVIVLAGLAGLAIALRRLSARGTPSRT